MHSTAPLSYLLTSEGSLFVYFSHPAGNSGLTTELSCIIRVDHTHSRARLGQYGTTVVGGTVQRVRAPEPLNTPRYGKLSWRSDVSWRVIRRYSNSVIRLSGFVINDKKIRVKV